MIDLNLKLKALNTRKLRFAAFPVILLIMQMCFSQDAYSAVLLDRIIAVVNNEVITWSELRNVIALEAKGYLGRVPENEKEAVMKDLERSFLSELVEIKLQLQEARKTGLDVSGSDIDGAIADIKKKFNLTDETLIKSLEAEGMTLEDYRNRFGEQILLTKVVNFEVKNSVVITDQELAEYYEANKDKLSDKERLRIRQIFFAAPKDASQKAAVEAKAGDIIKRLESGEDFSKLAEQFSEDPSRQFGGDLGYINRGSALKEVEDAAAALKTGEVSMPFWSSAGLHIIKLEDKTGGEGLDKLKDKIKEILFEKAFEARYREWKAGLKEKAYIEMKL
ncbi:MAG: peptidylprolyl isomerase [Nitrospirae bacterium]|nr:peptidylprolyl isomerase [Nitrospirota bacterium]